MEYITENAEETKELGEKIGTEIIACPAERGKAAVLALEGALGAGKTTFVQGLAMGLGVEQRIISPTFIIVRAYALNKEQTTKRKVQSLYHVDLYRLEGDLKNELDSLGLTDIWMDPKNVVVIEWAEKAKDYLPEGTKWVGFENLGEDGRKIVIEERLHI